MFDFEHSVDEEIENEEYRSKLIVINDNGILNHYTESKKLLMRQDMTDNWLYLLGLEPPYVLVCLHGGKQ